MERVGAGALQPAPSWHNLRDRRTTKVSAGAAPAALTAAAAAAALFSSVQQVHVIGGVGGRQPLVVVQCRASSPPTMLLPVP